MEVQTRILSMRDEYFSLLHKELLACSFAHVRRSDFRCQKHYQPIFHRNGHSINVPPKPGVYLIYRMDEDRPFYCGESRNLYDRIEYHFSDCIDSMNESTLKKYLSVERRGLLAMSEDLRIRYVEVPFGRKDFEEFLHEHYRINTCKEKVPRTRRANRSGEAIDRLLA